MVNPLSAYSQQTAIANPFQKQGSEQPVRERNQQDTETRNTESSNAPQNSERANASSNSNERAVTTRASADQDNGSRSNAPPQRGSVVDLSV